MTDFFGGILDPIRQIGNDVNGFFGANITNALGRGIANSAPPQNSVSKLLEARTLSRLDNYGDQNSEVSYHPTQDRVGPAKAENFESIEYSWLRRLQRFAQMGADSTKVNEKGGA